MMRFFVTQLDGDTLLEGGKITLVAMRLKRYISLFFLKLTIFELFFFVFH